MAALASLGSEHDRLRPQPYYTSVHGSVYYSPRTPTDARRRASNGPSFPAPLTQPRQRRPHSIHIVSYPPGFIPHELRPTPRESPQQSPRRVPPDFMVSGDTTSKERTKASKKEKKEEKRRKKAEDKAAKEKREKRRSIRSLRSLSEGGDRVSRVLGKILAVFSITPKTAEPAPNPAPRKSQSRPSSFVSFARRLSRIDPEPTEPPDHALAMAATVAPRPSALVGGSAYSHNRNSMSSIRSAKRSMSSSVTELPKPVASGSGVTCSILLAEPNVFLSGFDHDTNHRNGSQNSSALLRGKLQISVSKNVKIKSVTLKLIGKARTEWPEGIPPMKLDQHQEQTLRSQSLVFFHAMGEGMWTTEYGNQCIYTHKPAPATRAHSSLRNSLYSNHSGSSLHLPMRPRPHATSSLSAKELKRLSLQSVKSRSFGKGDSPLANQVQVKGYKVFFPGTYEYAFELPIDHSQLETTKLQYGSVKWELETTVERAGAFKPNLHGSKEVSIVRLPDQMSLEMTEPISISRQWEDQLHYDIMISGKSFPIGSKIPIAFKLTPLAKVQVHKLKVFVTESIEYYTNDRRVTRKDAGRKILLLERSAGKPLDKQFAASEIRILNGGELAPDQREQAREAAAARRRAEATSRGRAPDPLPEVSDNLLGDLDLGLETFWGSTEIEMNVQIPTCEMMAREKTLRLHPDCSWKNVNIVMRISRADPEDPTGKRRRHFEISIDSPFTILNCRATQANTALPEYCNQGQVPVQRPQMSCGCPDANPVDGSPSNSSAHLALVEQGTATPGSGRPRVDSVNSSVLPGMPRPAHFQDSPRVSGALSRLPPAERRSEDPASQPTSPGLFDRGRPIHLLRHPSFNPPAFDADEPPPPVPAELLTPPPNYDLIVGTPSVDGLADYFTRLAVPGTDTASDEATPTLETDPFSTIGVAGRAASLDDDHGDSSDSGDDDPARPHRRGRVNVANPRTPGGRLVPSRSLEIVRPVMRLDMTGVTRRAE
ncbi:hypothetical protein B0T18DRAFT_433745 [Schizothecium vesticola]|uniref:Arrestin C-terminal-like domain-containing protein n=1 Tax=Schizothecium vesticola TaxID=314040 RepID=A0AA40F7L7_9PEZI|nr:hypothetical protein B0T18DRAFT_433745 [Schizothecium vesticola]